MMAALSVLTLAGVAVTLFLVVWLRADIQDLKAHVKRESRVVVPVSWAPHHHHASLGKGYFALWRWQNGQWKLVMGIVPPGASAGLPPKEPGVCTGETRKVWVPSAKP